MELNNKQAPSTAEEAVGYLVVRVSTARGAIPLENAAVSIRGTTPESSGILYSLTTNSDGLTDKVSLPAPPLSVSQSSGGATPYSSWNIEVFKSGYVSAVYQSVPVYASIVSVQPAVLTPLPENFAPTRVYRESSGPQL